MTAKTLLTAMTLLAAVANTSGAADIKARPEFARKATWKMPAIAEVREQALSWLVGRGVDEQVRTQMAMLWSSAPDGDDAHLLELVAATLAAGDPRASELVTACSQPRRQVTLPAADWLADEKVEAFERNNLRLLYGRWLVQHALYDEALDQVGDLKTENVVDPAALLFYQSVVHHRMLKRDEGTQTIVRLLENETTLPRRYTSVARLMQADLEGLKDESLDHIARRMDDIRRRLDLGRAGPKVRSVEDGVIASLDKLIDQMEKQQQAAAAAAAAASRQGRGSAKPMAPMPDSRPAEMKGAGDVAKKPIGDQSGWGNLPPRERQEALQQIGKDFPAHYRDVIEQYFRKLATDNGSRPDNK